MEFNYVALGKRIKEERLSRGWNQADLAAKSGISDSHISGIERGNINFSVQNLVKIVNALDMSVDKILYDELYAPEVSCKLIEEAIEGCEPWEVKILANSLLSLKALLRQHELVPSDTKE